MKSIKNYIKIILFLSSLFLIISSLSYLFIPKNNLKEFGMIEVVKNEYESYNLWAEVPQIYEVNPCSLYICIGEKAV